MGGLDLSVGGDGQLSDVGKLGTGLGQYHHLPVLVGNIFHTDLMRVAVNGGIDAGGVGDHASGAPLLCDPVIAQMAHHDHIVGAFAPGLVHGTLYLAV